ncbi:fructuronate reductase, partial [Escherichia coli]|nr:fructuronate reductase [Escherichia coli]
MFVQDITPWEQRKLWLLNGAHTYLANAGLVRGHLTVADAIADAELRAGVDAFWAEAAAHLPAEVGAAEYAEQLI